MSELDFDQLVLEELTCAECGIRFGVVKTLLDHRRKDYRGFYCTNGHRLAYNPPEIPRDDELESLRDEASQAREEARQAKDQAAAAVAELDQVRAARRPLLWPDRR